MNGNGPLGIRDATTADVVLLHQLLAELAEAEGLTTPGTATPDDLRAALFGPRAVAQSVIAEAGDRPAGFALFWPTYSPGTGKTGLHLQDLYARPEFRGLGIGRALLAHVAELAVARGGDHVHWQVLRSNSSAQTFYRRQRARIVDDVHNMRLDGAELHSLVTGVAT